MKFLVSTPFLLLFLLSGISYGLDAEREPQKTCPRTLTELNQRLKEISGRDPTRIIYNPLLKDFKKRVDALLSSDNPFLRKYKENFMSAIRTAFEKQDMQALQVPMKDTAFLFERLSEEVKENLKANYVAVKGGYFLPAAFFSFTLVTLLEDKAFKDWEHKESVATFFTKIFLKGEGKV